MKSKRILATPSGYAASVLQDTPNGLVQLQVTTVVEPNVCSLHDGLGLLLLARRR